MHSSFKILRKPSQNPNFNVIKNLPHRHSFSNLGSCTQGKFARKITLYIKQNSICASIYYILNPLDIVKSIARWGFKTLVSLVVQFSLATISFNFFFSEIPYKKSCLCHCLCIYLYH